MGLPVGAVKNAMVKDGKDPKVIELDPEKSLSQHEAEMDSEEDDDKEAIEVANVPKRRRKKLDWKPIGKEKVDKASIWGDMSSYNLDLDMEEFDTLFVAQASPDQKKKKTPNKDTPKKKKASVQVISGKRGMNCGISLARVKVDFGIIADAIMNLKENVVTNEQLPVLKECLPDKDERFGLQQYLKKSGGSVEELCEAEKYMVAMLGVDNAAAKFDTLVLKGNFATRRNEVIDTAKAVETACDDVKLSLRLKKVRPERSYKRAAKCSPTHLSLLRSSPLRFVIAACHNLEDRQPAQPWWQRGACFHDAEPTEAQPIQSLRPKDEHPPLLGHARQEER